MTMVLLVAACVVVILLHGEVYRLLAYQTHQGTVLLKYEKRAAWLPGPEWIYPDQVCPPCQNSLDHPERLRGHERLHRYCLATRNLRLANDGLRDFQDRNGCTCPDPTHEWNRPRPARPRYY